MHWNHHSKSLQSSLIIIISLGFAFGQQDQDGVFLDKERKVKGQQYVTQTVVAKVIGSNGFSKEFLDFMRNGNAPIIIDNSTLVDGPNGTTSALITENVKTTVTKIIIPLSTSYMDSDWYRETLKKFLQRNRVAITNSTTDKEYNDGGSINIDLVILKLWAAATLRDNIITVFGTLLFTTDRDLPENLYASLAYLYELVRLRRISTIDFLDILENMSYENPQQQFKIFFQKLESVAPRYLRSFVTYWLENLYGNKVNISGLLTKRGGVLAADFLWGIEKSALLPIQEKVLFPKKTVMNTLPENEELLGKMLSHVLTGLFKGDLVLSRQLFAGILLHLPLNKFVSQADEYQRFFADQVRKGSTLHDEEFQNAISAVKLQEFSDPYELSKAIFRSLITAHAIDHELYENILIHLQSATNTFSMRNFKVMSPLIGADTVNIKMLLDGIAAEEYPADIVDAKDRLLYYIDRNYIDLEFALHGFNRHQQSTPSDMLIGVLTRIKVRSTNLLPELHQTITSLTFYMVYNEALKELGWRISAEDVTNILLSYQSPSLSRSVQDAAAELKILLQSEFKSMDHKLNKETMPKCSRPRQCVANILTYLVSNNQIQSPMCETKVKEWLGLVDNKGEPLSVLRSLGKSTNHMYFTGTGRSERGNQDSRKTKNEIYPGKYNSSPYKCNYIGYDKPIFISRLISGKVIITGKNGEVFFTSEKPELVDVDFSRIPIPHPGWMYNNSDVKELLPVMTPEERVYMMPVSQLLEKGNLIESLNITQSHYSRKGALLMDVLARSLEKGIIESNDQRKFIEMYLKLLQYTYKVLPPPPPTALKYFRHEVNSLTLLQAVRMSQDEDSIQKFEKLKSFLTTADLSQIKQDIDTATYPSKGTYFKYLLHKLKNLDYLNDEELSTIRFFEDKVMTSGYGAQPVDWTIVLDTNVTP